MIQCLDVGEKWEALLTRILYFCFCFPLEYHTHKVYIRLKFNKSRKNKYQIGSLIYKSIFKLSLWLFGGGDAWTWRPDFSMNLLSTNIWYIKDKENKKYRNEIFCNFTLCDTHQVQVLWVSLSSCVSAHTTSCYWKR